MTDDEIKRLQLAQARNMQAMTPEQMAERARQQQAGMQNAAQIYRPEQVNGLRNMWPPTETIGPASMPQMTRRQRVTQWLSRFWGKA